VELTHRTVTQHEERIPPAKVQHVKAVDHTSKRLDKSPNRKLHMVREPDKAVLDDRAGDPDHLGEAARFGSDLHEVRAKRGSFGETHLAHTARQVRRDGDAVAHPPLRAWPVAAVRYSG
jgi:hypothetical protein